MIEKDDSVVNGYRMERRMEKVLGEATAYATMTRHCLHHSAELAVVEMLTEMKMRRRTTTASETLMVEFYLLDLADLVYLVVVVRCDKSSKQYEHELLTIFH